MNTITIDTTSIVIACFTVGGTLFGIILSHYFTKKRKIDELLFVARKETYTEFMKNFGMAFGPDKIEFQGDSMVKMIETDYERNQRINRIFAQCRLLANPMLEAKLRHLYDLVIEDIKVKNLEPGKKEKDYIGYEIEALMRSDLRVIGSTELFFWQIFSSWKRFKMKKVQRIKSPLQV